MKTYITLTKEYCRMGQGGTSLKKVQAENLNECYAEVKGMDEEDIEEAGLEKMTEDEVIQFAQDNWDGDDYIEIYELVEGEDNLKQVIGMNDLLE